MPTMTIGTEAGELMCRFARPMSVWPIGLGSSRMHTPEVNLGSGEGEATTLRQIDRLLRLAHEYRRNFPRAGYRGLNTDALQVLLLLRRRGEMALCDIATALLRPRPSISNVVALLQQRGLVISSGDAEDHRIHYQRLSELGIAIADGFVTETLRRDASQ